MSDLPVSVTKPTSMYGSHVGPLRTRWAFGFGHFFQRGPMWAAQLGVMWVVQLGPMWAVQLGTMCAVQLGPMWAAHMGVMCVVQLGPISAIKIRLIRLIINGKKYFQCLAVGDDLM